MPKFLINGKERDLDEVQSLREILNRLQVDPGTVVVEHNEAVVPRTALAATPVHEGDKIEIVQFVGGGSETPGEPVSEVSPEAPAPAPKKKPSPRKSPKSKAAAAVSKNGPRNLVIVESPAKAKTINKFLGNDFLVEASMGHVRDLPRSKMGIDLEGDFKPHYITIRKATKTVKHLIKQAQGKETIYLAPDPDREGEAISWHLKYLFEENSNPASVRRVVFNEITKEAVREAFHHPRDIKMNLVDAQQARRILDRIVGYELSPLLWRKVGRGLSAGRVQSVALRLIVDREREIKAFVPVEYWSLEARLSKNRENEKIFSAKLDKIGTEKADLKNQEVTEKVRQDLLQAEFRVEKVERRERQRKPQAPYTTSKLQQEAYNRLGFPAAKTMRVAQELYEGVEIGEEGSVGLITYMRTDSVNVAVSAQKEAADYIRSKFGKEYLPEEPPVYKSKKNAQEAHEAIRPSSVNRDPAAIKSYLSPDAFRLYDLIWRKFVSSQMVPARDEMIAITILGGEKYYFKTTGKRTLFAGFGLVFGDLKTSRTEKDKDDEDDDEGSTSPDDMPQVEAGEILKLHELLGHQHFTKPPGRYNDASLVKALEEQGIGRPSTYAPTIYTLIYREYVARNGGALSPTELGEIVAELLVKHFPNILDIEFTANMEEELDKIEEGEMDWVKVIRDFYQPFQKTLEAAREEMKNFRREVIETDYNCDVCGRKLVIKWGRFGKFLACPGFPECKYTRSLPTGFFCPQEGCGGELVKRKSKQRRTFYGCSKYPKCNYITNKLPKKDEDMSDDDRISETDRETLDT